MNISEFFISKTTQSESGSKSPYADKAISKYCIILKFYMIIEIESFFNTMPKDMLFCI